MNQLDFVSDNLLSTNDAEVIAKKRENFKKVILNSVGYEPLAEKIVRETFDAGVVN